MIEVISSKNFLVRLLPDLTYDAKAILLTGQASSKYSDPYVLEVSSKASSSSLVHSLDFNKESTVAKFSLGAVTGLISILSGLI